MQVTSNFHEHGLIHRGASAHPDMGELELDSDVIWSWYTSTKRIQTPIPFRLALRYTWALLVHVIGLGMLWSVFMNESAVSLPGARNIGNTVFEVYFDRCEDIGEREELVEMVGDRRRNMFFEMDDRLWIGKDMKSMLFARYNEGQSNPNNVVEQLCREEGCRPTAITAINGETNATRMVLIFESFVKAFCTENATKYVKSELLPQEDPYAFGETKWASLTEEQVRLWEFLGWDEYSFDRWNASACRANGCIPQQGHNSKSWDHLSGPEFYAADALGFSAPIWDSGEDIRTRLRLTCDNYLERNGLFAYVQIAAFAVMILVSISEIRNFVLACILAYRIESTLPKKAVLFFISFVGYLFVPVTVICASGLVIFESPDELGVLMDSLALLFILEVNNYFQFMHNPSSERWKIHLTGPTYQVLEQTRDWFGRVASITLLLTVVLPLGALFTSWPGVFVHPVWLFNPMKAPGPASGWMLGMCLFFCIIVALVLVNCGKLSSEQQQEIVDEVETHTAPYRESHRYSGRSTLAPVLEPGPEDAASRAPFVSGTLATGHHLPLYAVPAGTNHWQWPLQGSARELQSNGVPRAGGGSNGPLLGTSADGLWDSRFSSSLGKPKMIEVASSEHAVWQWGAGSPTSRGAAEV